MSILTDPTIWINTYKTAHISDLGLAGNYKAMRFASFEYPPLHHKVYDSIEYRFSLYGSKSDIMYMRANTLVNSYKLYLLFASTGAFSMSIAFNMLAQDSPSSSMINIEGLNYHVHTQPESMKFKLIGDTTMEDFEHDFVIGDLMTRKS